MFPQAVVSGQLSSLFPNHCSNPGLGEGAAPLPPWPKPGEADGALLQPAPCVHPPLDIGHWKH